MRTLQLPESLLSAARADGIVVLAGAGVSAAPPSALPGWHQLHALIADALCDRIEDYLERKGYTEEIRTVIHHRRSADQFPPDYQAQLLAESCGEDYFRALQALDISTPNAAHTAIAHLAREGLLRAIVTTNFDRLIEESLETAGVAYETFFEPAGYERLAKNLSEKTERPLPVLKIHGSVEDHRSMVDTLKQRLLGRDHYLNECVSRLLESHLWLYLGFSAADLESDPNYLNVIPAAERSPGLVYVQWPGAEQLSSGAELLIQSYGDKATVIRAEIEALAAELARALQLQDWEAPPPTGENTKELLQGQLQQWAAALDPSDAVICLAGILEAVGETGSAFELLHRYWKDVIPADRRRPAFDRYRLQHGRLGMGTGMMSLVEDMNEDRGMESFQNLLRVAEKEPRAWAWAASAKTWAGYPGEAMKLLQQAMPIYQQESFSLEHRVDGWLAIAEVLFLTGNVEQYIHSWGAINSWAQQAGDLPRQARASAFHLLLMAEFMPQAFEPFRREKVEPILGRAARLNDPAVEGFDLLARGRYATKQQRAEEALSTLHLAIYRLHRAGRLPWCLYARIEYAKALMDARQLDDCHEMLNQINEELDRYQVLLPWYEEARGQYHRLIGRDDIARDAFEAAAEYAGKMGLERRATVYRQYLDQTTNG